MASKHQWITAALGQSRHVLACAAIVVTGTMYQKPAAGRMLLRLAEAIVLCIVEAVRPVTSHAEAR